MRGFSLAIPTAGEYAGKNRRDVFATRGRAADLKTGGPRYQLLGHGVAPTFRLASGVLT